MKILLTGATGFIGSHLYDQLSSKHQVYCLVRNPKKASALGITENLIAGDLSTESMQVWVESLPLDLEVVIHTASILFSHDVRDYYNTNFHQNSILFELLRKRYSRLHFIFLSSQAALGPLAEENSFEDATPNPISHYGKSKRLFEEQLYSKKPNDWSISILRPPMVIGPRDTGMKEFFDLLNMNIAFIPGLKGKKNEYSFISVYDLCTQIDYLIHQENEVQFAIFHLAYPEKITFGKLIEESKKTLQKSYIFTFIIPMPVLTFFARFLKYCHLFFNVKAQLNLDKISELKVRSWVIKSQKIKDDSYKWDLARSLKSVLSKKDI